MCIIIDTSRKDLYLAEEGDYSFVKDWVWDRGRLLVCTPLLKEYGKTDKASMRAHVVFLKDNDKVREITNKEMLKGKEMLENIIRNKKIKQESPNDHHILYLAAYTKCKLMLTDDTALIHDFKKLLKGRIVPKGEKGKVYLSEKTCP